LIQINGRPAPARYREAMTSEWFASWFDSTHYRRLYAHRDDSEASRFVDTLVGRLRPAAGAAMLDLGCGSGRHARHLARKGFDVTGLDLAASAIAQASEHAGPALRFRRHDMRQPFGRAVYDYVFSFFTSFGYFDAEEEQQAVVDNMAAALTPGGTLVLDYLNAGYADAHLIAAETIAVDGVDYLIRRWSDGRHFFKRIVVDEADGEPIAYREQVARLSLADFERMLAPRGLDLVELFGDYRLGPYDAGRSPRLILVAKRRERAATPHYLRDSFLRTRLTVSGETPR